jgi:hypothetical protein
LQSGIRAPIMPTEVQVQNEMSGFKSWIEYLLDDERTPLDLKWSETSSKFP